MKVHPHVAGLFVLADPDWRRKIRRGGLLLLLAPPLGWPAVLGYRKALVRHLFTDTAEPLPEWSGRTLGYVADGLKAMGVIFGHLLPLYALLGAIVVSRGWEPGPGSALLLAIFLVFPIFSTLSFPLACVLLAVGGGEWISGTECVALLAAYAAVVFLIPAGFLRVSRTGRYLSAFAVWRTVPFVLRHLGAYLRAWWYAGLMSLLGHLAIPFSPWGVVWCYLGIIFLFNEIIREEGEPGWLGRSLADPRFEGRGRLGIARIPDASGETAAVLDLGAFSVPLPRMLTR